MADAPNFAKLVPGFDFLQGLVKNAGTAIPGLGQWIAPTLDPQELEKRIEELRTVQFWLEQNARMLGATIQALEVQRMTLSTLKTMNVQMEDLRDAMRIRPSQGLGASAAWPGTAASEPASAPAPARARRPAAEAASSAAPAPAEAAAEAAASGSAVDPMQWWGALTRQFTDLAAQALKDTATDTARNLATTMVRQSFDAAGQTLKSAAAMPAAVVRGATGAAAAAAQAAGLGSGAPAPAPSPRKAATKAAGRKTSTPRAAAKRPAP